MQPSGRFERVLLYVGPPKTGSTSIELFVRRNRDALMSQGYFVPQTGLSNNQHIELAAILAQAAPANRRNRLNFQADMAAGGADRRREKFLAELDAELAAAPPGHTLFFMSEAIFPATPLEVQAYRALCARYAPRFESLMYLRRQDRWLASNTLQNRKVRPRAELTLNVGQPQRFATSVRTWHAESDRCHIRRFEPEFLTDGSLIHDFCATLGADRSGLNMTDIRTNRSPFQEQLELTDALNARLSTLPFDAQAFHRKRFLPLTAKVLGGAKVQFPRGQAIAAFQSFRSINTWLHDTIDPDGPPLFFNVDFSDYEAAPANDRRYTEEQLARLLSVISPGAPPATGRAELIEQIVSAFLAADQPTADMG